MKKVPHLPNCKCKNWEQKLQPEHEWYIDAPEFNNCFWSYIRHNDRPHGLKEIAEMLGLSISAITTIERKALAKLKIRLKGVNL